MEYRTGSLEIFISYSHMDERLLKKLEKHLIPLKRQDLITDWYDRRISPGKEWAHEINKHLDTAQLILLLVSPDYVASDYCYSFEVKRAIERHETGEACVIPVILRPADWEGTPFGKLQALPKDGKPVTTWTNRDLAYLDITDGIRKAIIYGLRRPVGL